MRTRTLRLFLCVLGIGAPVRPVVAQCPDGTPPPCSAGRVRPAVPPPNSIAVLYFETRDTADRYLADGLTEEVIGRLQQLPRLEVKSRFESQRARRIATAAPAAIGRSLGVRYLVGGTVQRAGERVVVRVELTQAERAVGIWSGRYDQSNASVLDVIDQIAQGVATGVAGRLLPDESAELARRPTADAVAYEDLVRGNFYLAQRSAASFARAADAYEAALARDPRLKQALARRAYVYVLGAFYGVGDLSQDTVAARAARYAGQAVRDAPDLSDTWIAQGFQDAVSALAGTGAGMADARAEMARAVALDPRNPEAHHQFAQVLVFTAEDSLAEAEYRLALALDPLRAVTLQELTTLALFRHRPREARAWADSAIAVEPDLARAWGNRALARLELGDTAGARSDIERGTAVSGQRLVGELRALRAVVAGAIGDTAAARRVAAAASADFSELATAGLAWLAVGATTRALDALEHQPSVSVRCYAARWPTMQALRGMARFDRLTADCPWRR